MAFDEIFKKKKTDLSQCVSQHHKWYFTKRQKKNHFKWPFIVSLLNFWQPPIVNFKMKNTLHTSAISCYQCLNIDYFSVRPSGAPEWKIDGRLFNVPFHRQFQYWRIEKCQYLQFDSSSCQFYKAICINSIEFRIPPTNVYLSFYGAHTVRFLTFQFNAALFVIWKLESHHSHQLPRYIDSDSFKQPGYASNCWLNFFYYILCHKQHLLLVHTQPWIRTNGKITNFCFIKIIFRHVFFICLMMFHIQLLFGVQKYWWIHQKFVSRRHCHHSYCNHHKLSVASIRFDVHVSMKFIDRQTDTANQIFSLAHHSSHVTHLFRRSTESTNIYWNGIGPSHLCSVNQ